MSDGTTGNAPPATAPAKPLEQLFGELRPKLHRYCARMTGSVIDGEDVVQETLLKALQAQAPSEPLSNPEGWLFRIAHNAALDFLRRRARDQERQSEEDPDMLATATSVIDSRQAVAASLRTFMQLPVAQRSSVILTRFNKPPRSSTATSPRSNRRCNEGGSACARSQPTPARRHSRRSTPLSENGSPPMWSASTRTTSTRSAPCWPRTFSSRS